MIYFSEGKTSEEWEYISAALIIIGDIKYEETCEGEQ